jgi:hypothetical protein
VGRSHKAIAGMDALAALVLCNLNDAIAIEVGRGIAEVNGVWGAQRMLGASIWVGEEGRGAHTVFRGGAAYASGAACQPTHCLQARGASHSAISPRLAIKTEVRGLATGAAEELWRTALAATRWRERRDDF